MCVCERDQFIYLYLQIYREINIEKETGSVCVCEKEREKQDMVDVCIKNDAELFVVDKC